MHRILFALTLVIVAPLTALAQQTAEPAAPAADPKARAQAVLNQARAVIWDETKFKPLQSLTINATSRRVQGQTESTTEMTLDVLLPDKFLQTTVRFLGAAEFTSILAVNGAQTWSDFKQPGAGLDIGAAKAAMAGGSGAKADIRGKKETTGDSPSGFMPQNNQADLGRMLLAWLLMTPGTLPVEFTYAGQATAQAEGRTADVLDAKGPNDFAARLFIDQQTHQLLMLTYQLKMPNKNPPRDPPASGQGNPKPAGNRPNPPMPEEVEIRWVVSDYRNQSGLNLPHRLTKSTGGQITGEIEIHKVKVNPALKPDKFENKQEKKK